MTKPRMPLEHVLANVHRHTNDAVIVSEAEPMHEPGPRIVFVNAAFTRATGYAPEEVIGRNPRILQGPDTDQATLARIRTALRAWQPVREELLNYRKDGTPFWVELSIVPVADETGWFHYWVSVQRDITSRRQADEAIRRNLDLIRHQARHDALTGLLNRRGFEEAMAETCARSAESGRSFQLLHVDLDRFKVINDTLGHAAGDCVLEAVARRIGSLLRPGETAARIGGDEFVVLREDSDEREAEAFGHALIDTLGAPVGFGAHRCRFGVSVGATAVCPGETDVRAILARSDIALYRGKAAGRNSFRAFTAEMARSIRDRVSLAEELADAVAQEAFEPHFMPQVRAGDLALDGFEVLARWMRPGRDEVPPAVFVPLADELKLLSEIDRQILVKAMAHRDRWLAEGLAVPPLSVNVSARRLHDPDLIPALRAMNLAPDIVSFELLETIFLDDASDRVLWTIDALRDLGVGIEIDDFGTGHASVISLTRIRPDRLKIDRRLTADIETDRTQREIADSMIRIGRALGIRIVAEGVETPGQAKALADLGCDVLQGFLFGKAVPAAECRSAILGTAGGLVRRA